LLLTSIDSVYFGRLTITPLAFLKRNVLESISVFYGQSPLHFYFTSALPFICFTTLPYTLYGLWTALYRPQFIRVDRSTRRLLGSRGESDPLGLKTLAQVTLFFIAAMSFLGHKEVRFLQPIAPVLHIFEGYALTLLPSLQALCRGVYRRGFDDGRGEIEEAAAIRQSAQTDRTSQARRLRDLSTHTSSRNRQHVLAPRPRLLSLHYIRRAQQSVQEVYHRHGLLACVLLGAHVVPIIYLSFHSRGQVAIVERIGQLARSGQVDRIEFLMPCHSTPWMSHIHDERLSQEGNSRFITCEPPLDGQDIRTYKDESDYFYEDPVRFLLHRYTSPPSSLSSEEDDKEAWPSHLALFEALLSVEGNNRQSIASLLDSLGYQVHSSFWNSLFHLDHRRRGRVILMNKAT
jgi:phosphatidylinositol glycan class B